MSSSSIDIRDAGEADLAGLRSLEAQAFAADRLSRRSFRRLMASASVRLRVAGPPGALLGYCMVLFRRGATVARLYSIAVAKAARGAGLAAALMADAERLAAARRCRALRLEVREDNAAALRLYRRLGYRPIGRRQGYYADGGDALRLEKALDPRPAPARRRAGSASAPGLTAKA